MPVEAWQELEETKNRRLIRREVFNPIAIIGSFFLMLSIPHSIPTELPAGGRTEMTAFQRVS